MNEKVELFNLNENQPNTAMPGGRTWVFTGADELTIKYSEMWDPALVMHSHPQEQINIVLSGHVVFRVDDALFELKAGSIIRIPQNASHGIEKFYSEEEFHVIQLVAPCETGKTQSPRVKDIGLEGWPRLEK